MWILTIKLSKLEPKDTCFYSEKVEGSFLVLLCIVILIKETFLTFFHFVMALRKHFFLSLKLVVLSKMSQPQNIVKSRAMMVTKEFALLISTGTICQDNVTFIWGAENNDDASLMKRKRHHSQTWIIYLFGSFQNIHCSSFSLLSF